MGKWRRSRPERRLLPPLVLCSGPAISCMNGPSIIWIRDEWTIHTLAGGLARRLPAERQAEEREDIGGLGDDLAGGLAGAVSGRGLDPDQNWLVAALRGLHGRSELEQVAWHDPVV